MKPTIKVTILPEGKTVYVLPGTSIVETAGEANIPIELPCGGKGLCGKCKITVVEGKVPPLPSEEKLLGKEAISKGARLACQAKIYSSCKIYIPGEIRISAQKILVESIEGEREVCPSVWKYYVELEPPTLERNISDLDLLRKAMPKKFFANIYILRELHNFLKTHNYKATGVFSNGELIHFEEGDTTSEAFGVAFDIGTTTVVGTLMDVKTGKELAVSARMNPQVVYGADVISRIEFAMNSTDGLGKLHLAIIGTMNEMLKEMTKVAKIPMEKIYKIVLCGNSTMQSIILKISPESLSSIPFSLVVREGIEVKAIKLGIIINPDGMVYVFPNIGGFVGGDTVSMMLSTGQYKTENIKLSVDIGTNGEIMLGNRNHIIAASTAAGPAFEGARISQGMRAMPGAIEKVVFADDVLISTVGNASAIGICGTGLIDTVAEMLRTGIIDETGRIQPPETLEGKLSDKILERIVDRESSFGFKLVDGNNTGNGNPILITQRDI
ncbi:MAG: DUF4445 domain-containing protein, partial [Candidatus Omnitrophica bacterium]|nr:DUF4445 domain-containing protein [Candidatus Omnitrophota bacterium]